MLKMIQLKLSRNSNLDTASIPVNSDFTHWAGLYRDVELVQLMMHIFLQKIMGQKESMFLKVFQEIMQLLK